MQQNESAESPRDPFGSRIEDLAAAIEERPPVEVEQAPPTRSRRHVYWLIGAICAVAIGVAEVAILARSTTPDAPPPPPDMLAAYENDPCGARMSTIMSAVSAYTRAHGVPPPNLEMLTPEYLAFTPIDPAVNKPYGYEAIGQSVSLSCPSAGTASPS